MSSEDGSSICSLPLRAPAVRGKSRPDFDCLRVESIAENNPIFLDLLSSKSGYDARVASAAPICARCFGLPMDIAVIHSSQFGPANEQSKRKVNGNDGSLCLGNNK